MDTQNTATTVLLEGTMDVPMADDQKSNEEVFDTLDEPIKETFLRDAKAVGSKFWHVLYPKEKKTLLKDWDLWGPLFLCTLMAMLLQGSESSNNGSDGGPEFAEVFVLVWVGAFIVTLNSKLLGGNISVLQSVCVLGYCLLPVAIALIMCRIILIAYQTTFLFILRFLIAMSSFIWGSYASMIFLGDSQPHNKKILAGYPIFLFYFIMSWLVLSRTA